MEYIRKNILLIVVFLTGAAVLVIEVVAVRVLSPYFGNTIFTVSSVLSVILAALSLGYYVGGKLADQHPSLKWFFGIILTSGLSVLILHVLTLLILPFLGFALSITSGPLISALILFFIPGFLLGTLSPFVIKLQKTLLPEEGIGSVSGKVFFWSTLGSICGSLLTGFVLIPNFGINQIILVTGIFLTFLGLLPLIYLRTSRKKVGRISALVIVVLALALSFARVPNEEVLFSEEGVYERMTVYDGTYNGRPARFFQQDRSNSGGMYLDSEELMYEYSKYYVAYKVFKPDIENTLVIGGGAYSIPKALLKESPDVKVDVAEIEPSLFELSKKYFQVPDDPRLVNYVVDGRRLLHDSNKEYDLIFSDVYYSLFSIPTHFTTKEFFETAKSKMSPGGVFMANMIGDLSQDEVSLIMSEIKTFRTIFPNSYFFAVRSPDSLETQNNIFIGYNSDRKVDLASYEIRNHKDEAIRTLNQQAIDIEGLDFSKHIVLTDNFAPVEHLTSKILKKGLPGK
ncbi:MAG: fused MFS/spermidine synthase [Candidatus Paceibacterota bacterium]